jgi:transposase-like protein
VKNSKEVVVRENAVMGMPFGGDLLSEAIRLRIREAMRQIANEEMDAALGATHHERTDRRRGYRHGSEERTLTTGSGKTTFNMPRAKIFGPDGVEREWQSTMIPRYARRCRAVDAALLGMYFGGVNTRKVKQAIRPLLRNSPLSKSAISRLIVRLKAYFEAWSHRSLAGEDVRYVYLDGICVRVRCGGKTESLPVLAAVGVRADGEKVLLALELCGAESTSSWKGLIESLSARGLRAPRLAIIDGNPGLTQALAQAWPKTERQRCAVHKLRNLHDHAPKRHYDEIKDDFHTIVYAENYAAGLAAYEAFLRKWKRSCEGVARSLEEAGTELLAFYRYPQSQWKSLRTTNIIERINGEFRRRLKTQSSFPSEQSVLVLLFGLMASGMIRMRRIEGHADMSKVSALSEIRNEGQTEVRQLVAA